jgi:hypothetical protein
MENIWQTSVNELMGIFRGSLLSLIPWLEKARINWKEGEAYDEFDNIAESLYKNIVCSSLFGETLDEYPIANYDLIYKDYSELNFVRVLSNVHKDKLLAFISLQSVNNTFDSVKTVSLDSAFHPVEYLVLDLANVDFSYYDNLQSGSTLKNLDVIL